MSKWRKMFWPIYGDENKKFIPMLLMLGLSLFNYTSLRIIKDALIVTAPGAGAPVLSFLKGFVVLPGSLLFVFYYGIMNKVVSSKKVFYAALIPFLVFFVLFALIFYPLGYYIHASEATIRAYQAAYPAFQYFVPIVGYWSYSLFYVFSELWGSVSITLLFWQFANLVVTKDEVSRFYPLFGAYSNIGLILGGLLQTSGAVSIPVTSIIVVISAATIGVVYWYVTEVVMKGKDLEVKTKKKSKPGIVESFKVIAQSRYLGYIVLLVLAYNMTANLVEITWKDRVRELYPAKDAYKAFMGKFFVATGVFTLIFGTLVKNVLGRFGWLTAALITPAVLFVTSSAFYIFTLYSNYILPSYLLVGTFPLVAAVIIGAVQNIASKGTKYTLFDPTTQMTYRPLDEDLKKTGKAAVDVLGGRVGKSFGGYLQVAALMITGGTQMTIAPMLLMFIVIIVCVWVFAAKKLSVEYADKLAEQEEAEKSSAK